MNNLKNVSIIEIKNEDDLVLVQITASGFLPCYFLFHKKFITCYGDIDSFTWRCTWNTPYCLRTGATYASNFSYITGKLDHKHTLMEYNEDLLEKWKETQIKRYLEDCDTEEEKHEFMNKWNEAEYLLWNVDGYRLEGFDNFCNEMNIDPSEEYDSLFELPPHYNVALEMLQAIEKYFSTKEKAERKV